MTKQKPNEVDKSETFKNIRINELMGVINGEDRKGKKYIEIIKSDKSADQPELIWAREEISRLRRALLEFDVQDRCYVILHVEIIGLSRTQIVDLYGIHKDLMSRLAGQYKKPKTVRRELREIKKRVKVIDVLEGPYIFNIQLLAFIAVLARIPLTWLTYNKPIEGWEDRHFANFNKQFIIEAENYEKFMESLINKSNVSHFIYPLIVKYNDGFELYLRIEVLHKSFIIELFNLNNQMTAIVRLKKLLFSINFKTGYMETVVQNQINFCLMEKNWPDSHIPPEFKPLDF